MLEDIGGRYRRELPGSRIKHVTVVTLLDPVQARDLGYGHLFLADINSRRVVSILQHEPDQLPWPQPMSSTGPAVGVSSIGRISRR